MENKYFSLKRKIRAFSTFLHFLKIIIDIYPHRVYYTVILKYMSGRVHTVEKKSCSCMADIKHKHREEQEYKQLVCRLNRIEGQVRGIKKMLEEERYCVDILTQVSAVQSALNAFNKELLGEHIKTCVVNDIRQGNDEVVDELVSLLQKMMK